MSCCQPGSGTLAVPDVRRLYRGVQLLVAMTVLFGLLFGIDAYQDQETDDHQDATDARLDDALADLEATNLRLEEEIAARAAEASREAARACIGSHIRYALLQQVLTAIGRNTAMSDVEVAELLRVFPAPACDRGEAEAELATG